MTESPASYAPGSGAGWSIPLLVPEMGGNEQRYLADAASRNEIVQGEYIPRFERMVADYVGGRHAVAVSSGTAALHLALLAAGVGPGDEVILPALTFIAPANAVRYCGAEPVFVDVEEDYWQMDLDQAPTALTERTKAILAVALLGHPLDGDAIIDLAVDYDLMIVKDITEGLGAESGEPADCMVREGCHAELACLSFNATKLITTGGGGMVLTDDADLAIRIRHLANQGKSHPWEFIHDETAFNYRLSNLHAAVGCAQMERIDDFLAAKRRIAETYRRELAGVPGITVQQEAPWARSSWWLNCILVDPAEYGMDSRALGRRLAEHSAQSRPLFQPLNLSPAFAGRQHAACPVAERLWKQGLCLPSSVGLSQAQQERVVKLVRKAGKGGSL